MVTSYEWEIQRFIFSKVAQCSLEQSDDSLRSSYMRHFKSRKVTKLSTILIINCIFVRDNFITEKQLSLTSICFNNQHEIKAR